MDRAGDRGRGVKKLDLLITQAFSWLWKVAAKLGLRRSTQRIRRGDILYFDGERVQVQRVSRLGAMRIVQREDGV